MSVLTNLSRKGSQVSLKLGYIHCDFISFDYLDGFTFFLTFDKMKPRMSPLAQDALQRKEFHAHNVTHTKHGPLLVHECAQFQVQPVQLVWMIQN